MNSLDRPFGMFGHPFSWFDDYELIQEDDQFMLSVELPGFETEEIHVAWDDGVLNVSAEHVDEDFGQQKTFHRRFRFPAEIDDNAIAAHYKNGILQIVLPLEEGTTVYGTEIPVQG